MRRMMKGDEEGEMMIGMIVLVVGFAMTFMIIFMRFAEVSAMIEANQERIAAIDEAHRALACLKGGEDFLDAKSIVKSKLESCGIIYKVCIMDVETSKSWISCPLEDPDHSVYMMLKSGTSAVDTMNNMGVLNVKK